MRTLAEARRLLAERLGWKPRDVQVDPATRMPERIYGHLVDGEPVEIDVARGEMHAGADFIDEGGAA